MEKSDKRIEAQKTTQFIAQNFCETDKFKIFDKIGTKRST